MIGEILGELAFGLVEGLIEAIITPDKKKREEKREAKKAGAKKAGKIIKNGGIVAFPTETVYGLGADAFNSEAVSRIYMAKGRPNDNPLILHIANQKKFYDLAYDPPDYAKKLIEAYWPGPLTLVVKKKPELPIWLGSHPLNQTETIGIRMPQNAIARAIIEYSKKVIAAPSANRAGKPSPTSAKHIDFDDNEIDMIVEGGVSKVGLESTVVDVTGEIPLVLRPGAITTKMIYETTGIEPISNEKSSDIPRSPGMKYRHYAPNAPMTIISANKFGEKEVVKKAEKEAIADYMIKESLKKVEEGKTIGLLVTNSTRLIIKEHPLFSDTFVMIGKKVASSLSSGNEIKQNPIKIVTFGDEVEVIAKNLFASLRQFNQLEVSEIYAEAVPNIDLGEAIMNRMQKAAEGRVVIVNVKT